MGTTTKLALPYPANTDPADVPADMQELADRIDLLHGTVSGFASLDATGKIPAAQLPAIAGSQLAYADITAAVVAPVGTPATVVSAASVNYDGTPILVEFYAPAVLTGATVNSDVYVHLYQDAASLGQVAQLRTPAASSLITSVYGSRLFAPAAGNHVFSIRASAVVAAGQVLAGVGGAGAYVPGFLRTTRG